MPKGFAMDTMGYQYPTGVARNDPQYVAYLEQRIAALEARSHSAVPNTKIVAPGFLTRAFAIWGHYFVAQFLIGIVLTIVWMIIGLIFAGSMGALFGPMLEGATYY